MGWKGTTRSLVATARKIDRANKRAAREHAAYEREVAKLHAEATAEADVDRFEAFCDDLMRVHAAQVSPIDWKQRTSAKEPAPPPIINTQEYKARRAIKLYTPGFLDRLFKLEAGKRQRLQEALEKAVAADADENRKAENAYNKQHLAWSEGVQLAKRVLEGDTDAELQTLESEMSRFSDAECLGRRIEFSLDDKSGWTIQLHAHPVDDLPQEKLSLLKTRKLSRKAMPKGELMALHQANVCGAVLRCASEFFGILPHDTVEVHALLDLLDPANGHVDTETVIRCSISRDALKAVNLMRADPVAVLVSFDHDMRFMKTKGFQKLKAT
jgi:hypothetical protein